jgi:hypothetical protein
MLNAPKSLVTTQGFTCNDSLFVLRNQGRTWLPHLTILPKKTENAFRGRVRFSPLLTLATPALTREDSLNRLQWHRIQAVSSIQ